MTREFVKLDARNGDIVWRTLTDAGGMNGSAFSSPIMASLGGHRQILVQTRTELAGVDPESGDVLWNEEVPAFRGMNILTPTVVGGQLFTSSYGVAEDSIVVRALQSVMHLRWR